MKKMFGGNGVEMYCKTWQWWFFFVSESNWTAEDVVPKYTVIQVSNLFFFLQQQQLLLPTT